MRLLHALRLLLLGVLVFAMAGEALARDRVWVALPSNDGVYAETAEALRKELGSEASVRSNVVRDLLDANQSPPALIVTVGTAAFDSTLKWLNERYAVWGHVPVLAILLPRAAYEARLAAESGRSSRLVSAVLLDQPLSRQLALIRRALPDRERVAVLPGPLTRPLLPQLQREAASLGLRLFPTRPVDAADQIYPALREAFEAADVLLALPDPLIYNANTLQNILLASYRARVPLVAFSAAYVKAGALLSVFATPQQVARAAVAAAKSHLAGRGLPPPHAPGEFTVVANPHVAASLGLRLDDEKQIADELRRAEGRP